MTTDTAEALTALKGGVSRLERMVLANTVTETLRRKRKTEAKALIKRVRADLRRLEVGL